MMLAPDTGPDTEDTTDLSPGSDLNLAIDAIIADLAAKQARLSAYIDEVVENDRATHSEIARLMSLHGQNAARLGRLLRDRQALGGTALDELAAAVNQALDELSEELCIDL